MINLSWSQVTNEGLKILADNGDKFESLLRMGFSNDKITDAGVKALADNRNKFKSLQRIYLQNN